jgi:hypothetical protein
MKRLFFILITAATLLLTACGTTPSSSEKLPAITVVNNTGFTVWHLRLSPSHEELWGRDLLGRAVLPNGNSFIIELPYPLSHTDKYDIQMIDEDTDTYTKWDVLIKNNAVITFTFDDLD